MRYGRGLLFRSRRTIRWFVAFWACGLAVLSAAQQASQAPPASSPAANAVPAAVHGVIQLDGPWHFQMGDDPRWADPALDDSSWLTVELGKSLAEQGFEPYAGYAWYRLRIQPGQLHFSGDSGSAPLHLLVTAYGIGQLAVYDNGVEVGHTRGMTDSPKMYESAPIDVNLPPATNGPIILAVRTWAAPGIPISHGLLDRVEAGRSEDIADRMALAIARKWDQQIIAEMVLVFLFLGVAALGGSSTSPSATIPSISGSP